MMFTLLVVLILGLGIGYAALLTNLSIDGTSTMLAGSWNVHFQNLVLNPNNVELSTGDQNAAIITDTSISYIVTLKNQGDYYEFTVDVRNDGTIDAMVETINATVNNTSISNLPSYLKFEVTYEDGMEISENHLLAAGEKETYRVMLLYKTDLDSNDLPGPNVTNTISFGVDYVQSEKDIAYSRNHYFYSNYESVYPLETTTSNMTNVTTNYYNILQGNNGYTKTMTFIRYEIENEQIIKRYIGFEYKDNVYYLTADGAILNEVPEISIYYEENKELLQNLFGADNCEEKSNGIHYNQLNPNYSIHVGVYGEIKVVVGDYSCDLNSVSSSCKIDTSY